MMFTKLCLGYSNQPHAALEHIRQVHTDMDGNAVSSSVEAYYQQLMNASRPFSSQREYPISVCAHFINSLDPRLLTGFRCNFPNHSIVQPLDAAHHWKVLQEILQAAQMAKDDFLMITRVSREAVGLSQAFITTSPGRGSSSNPIVGAYPSQAEDTMRRYAPGGGHLTNGSANTPGDDRQSRCPFACNGCGGPHPRTEFKNGEHIVICPNRGNPGVRDNAKRNIDQMKANHQKRHRQNTKRKNLGTANYSDFDSAGQEHIKEQVLLSLKSGHCKSSNTTSVVSSVMTPSFVYFPRVGIGHTWNFSTI
jgi:hypothetical protein